MGVPALFRWLSQKYPKIVSPVIEVLPQEEENYDGTKTKIPVDTVQDNPNGEEFDNLYLDMNGIVHPCSHPEDRPAPADEREMMLAVFEYTDRVVNMVRPRKLLVIAVDGVAPRAKMNQQRSRRFRSAQEAAEKDAAAAAYHANLAALGKAPEGDGGEPKKTWDSNQITPGTPFMNTLAKSLRYWVAYKQTVDPAWATIKAVISDATYPGEGEHKIMNFIRSQRLSPKHDPNTRHVMYGLDADLIMLGLATHEPHFRILREDVFANDTKPGHCRKCNQPGHFADQCVGKAAPKPGEMPEEQPLKPFIWLNVGILREYLAIEMHPPQMAFPFDLERAIDEWVLMCFFVGNDFLPHLPSLSIRENGIDILIAIWRDSCAVMDGYVSSDGRLNLERVSLIMEGVAKQEQAIFKRRRETEVKQALNAQRREREKAMRNSKRPRVSDSSNTGFEPRRHRGGELPPDPNALPMFAPSDAQTRNDPRYAKSNLTHADIVGGKTDAQNKSAAAALREQLKNGNALGKRSHDDMNQDSAPAAPDQTATKGTSGQLGGNSDGSDLMPEDTVKLWEEGYQDRYYAQKFKVDPFDVAFRHKVAAAYVEGLQWVLLYYFQGCPSWTWYYPYHYAPFAEDFQGLKEQVITFDKGKPFKPYEQLMGVMPIASNHTIPKAFHSLMTDDDSPIRDFYPIDFDVDLNGKKFAWQGVVLLPFIDEKLLLDAMATKYPELTQAEHDRNEIGKETLMVSTKHPLESVVLSSFYGKREVEGPVKLDIAVSDGLTGKISKDESHVPHTALEFPFSEGHPDYTSLESSGSLTMTYHMPASKGVHKSTLLPGVIVGTPVLDYNDVLAARNQASRTGRQFGGVRLTNDGGRSDGRPINYANGNRNGSGRHDGPAPAGFPAGMGMPNFNAFQPPPGFELPPGFPAPQFPPNVGYPQPGPPGVSDYAGNGVSQPNSQGHRQSSQYSQGNYPPASYSPASQHYDQRHGGNDNWSRNQHDHRDSGGYRGGDRYDRDRGGDYRRGGQNDRNYRGDRQHAQGNWNGQRETRRY